jgi:hypothetical protein
MGFLLYLEDAIGYAHVTLEGGDYVLTYKTNWRTQPEETHESFEDFRTAARRAVIVLFPELH